MDREHKINFYQRFADEANETEKLLLKLNSDGEFAIHEDNLENFLRGQKRTEEIRYLMLEAQKVMMTLDFDENDEFLEKMFWRLELIRSYLRMPEYLTENTIIELDIPSGKLIASDSLFEFVPNFDGHISINHGQGLDEYTRNINQKTGMAYIFSSNTSPSITRNQQGSLQVVSFEYNEDKDEEILEQGEEVLANISTDLWAVSLIDLGKWIEYGGIETGSPDPNSWRKYTVIDVTPGKYQVSIYTTKDQFDFDTNERSKFADIELIKAY